MNNLKTIMLAAVTMWMVSSADARRAVLKYELPVHVRGVRTVLPYEHGDSNAYSDTAFRFCDHHAVAQCPVNLIVGEMRNAVAINRQLVVTTLVDGRAAHMYQGETFADAARRFVAFDGPAGVESFADAAAAREHIDAHGLGDPAAVDAARAAARAAAARGEFCRWRRVPRPPVPS